MTRPETRQFELLEAVRALLFDLEQGGAPRGDERVFEMRLRIDREIEALRRL